MNSLSFAQQSMLIFKRTARDGLRNFPLVFVAPTLLASFIAAIFGAVFNSIADSPSFPSDSFLTWVAPASVLLTAFVGAGYAASSLLRDIESGYLDRLRLLPISAAALVVGRATFEGVRIIIPASVVLGGSTLFGAENAGGPIAFVATIAITCLVAVMWNGLFFMVAMTTRSQQTVLGLQPLFMPVIMFSTFFAPTNEAPTWFRSISDANPFTHLLDGVRSVLNNNAEATPLLIGLGSFIALGIATYAVSAKSFAGAFSTD